MQSIEKVIEHYYATLRRAVDGEELDFDQLPFAEEISVIGPNEQFIGMPTVRTMYPQFIKIVRDFRIKERFYSKESACILIEFFPINGAPPILTAEWFHIKEGKIAQIHPIYDTASWEQALKS